LFSKTEIQGAPWTKGSFTKKNIEFG
jgi:hypothetical protein